MTEQMISGMVKAICGSFKIKYHLTPGEEPVEVDFTPPFRRVSMMDGLEDVLECKLPALDDPEVGTDFDIPARERRRGRGGRGGGLSLMIYARCIHRSFDVARPGRGEKVCAFCEEHVVLFAWLPSLILLPPRVLTVCTYHTTVARTVLLGARHGTGCTLN